VKLLRSLRDEHEHHNDPLGVSGVRIGRQSNARFKNRICP
jgi:hypothetical protein